MQNLQGKDSLSWRPVQPQACAERPTKQLSVHQMRASGTLHKWVQIRAIPHVKAGRALRFDLAALNRYIDEHTIGTID
jgi:hypothetical protein